MWKRYLRSMQMWKRFLPDGGATMVEYALIVTLIALVAIGAVTYLGLQVSDSFDHVGEALNSAGN